MNCTRRPQLFFKSAPGGPLGWRTTIRADGLPEVKEDGRNSDEAKTLAYASLQRLVDASESQGNPLDIEDFDIYVDDAEGAQ
ncbi:hypothetical protein [Myxococcus sp. NMCA1]|uniref:hypothetical protein n=1 Tax=Myxococcus sp. NMCA1 TaxID=2996785 RepID=UPI00228588D6|nr:hypothetical protein [Myxococcus sp. NMCA1]WAM23866.1 hypothetical protein OZ403_25325 [Myxococcus sp. NMCA1]